MLIGKRKRYLVLLLFVLLPVFFLFVCSGCRQGQTKRLRILVDLRDVGRISSEPGNLCRVFQYRGGLDPDSLEIELLPTEKAERNVRIQALRTELMSGGGPDVFLMTCNFSGWRSGQGVYRAGAEYDSKPFEQERLFNDVQKAMENRCFLPLDAFFGSAEHFDPDMMLPAVLEAGKTEEGQMVLPITFTFPVAVYQKDIVQAQGEFPTSWREAVDSPNRAAQKAYGVAAWNQFSDILPELTDASGWGLSVTKEELVQRVKEALGLYDAELSASILSETDNLPESLAYEDYIHYAEIAPAPFPADQFDGFLSERSLDYYNMSFWAPGFYDYRWDVKKYSQLLKPIYNTDGGVTAGVTTYACINRNTEYPEEAFKVLDTLFCTDVLCAHGSTLEEYPEINFQTVAFYSSFGIPVRNDLLRDRKLSFQLNYLSQLGIEAGPNDELFAEYTALRSEVTHARFYGTLDQELQTMYEACLEAESDEEIEKIISKAYDTMLMILAES